MVFNSLTFAIFLAVVLAVYWLPIGWTARKRFLLIASYVFYAAWNPPFVLLLWISTGVDWWAARRLFHSAGRRRPFLMVSLFVNLGLLGYFKYAGFLLTTTRDAFAGLGVAYQPPEWDVILPVGISFYTFQTLSYTLDVYRGRIRPAGSFVDFALYVSFFPQLVAGPIVRAGHFLPQCAAAPGPDAARLGLGLAMLVAGLFQKVVLADGILAPVVDAVYADPSTVGRLDAWIGTSAFAGQILMDFSGYSTCAIGTAVCLGFSIPRNFRFPYAATGFSDFWRRWHISLSTWLRDYLYISLGGNRLGRARTLANLMTTMLIGGLWHGASWNFVLWGGIHGSLLVIERLYREWRPERGAEPPWWRQMACMLGTFLVVCVAWVPFRCADLSQSVVLLTTLFAGSDTNLELGLEAVVPAMATVSLLLVGQWLFRERDLEQSWLRLPVALRAALLGGALLSITMAPGDDRAFIYFQF